jgi:hypothetical protein
VRLATSGQSSEYTSGRSATSPVGAQEGTRGSARQVVRDRAAAPARSTVECLFFRREFTEMANSLP